MTATTTATASASTPDITREKLEQAPALLDELGIDAWITFVRETGDGSDPVLPFLYGGALTWTSALIVTRDGRRLAIVGKYDDEAVRTGGHFDEVRTFVHGVGDELRRALGEIDPKRIGVNYSTSDPKADGLTHGMHELLKSVLADTPYAGRLESAELVVGALRGRKSATELAAIRRAIAVAEEIFDAVEAQVRPGTDEVAVWRFMHEQVARRGLATAWEPKMCPIVTTGPGSMVGHGTPTPGLLVRPGCIFHLDFGARVDGYCSDLQRSWWVGDPASVPAHVQAAFDAVRGAIEAGFAALRPGVEGWTVDEASRQSLIAAGYEEYQHGTGHQVGRAAHDGGTMLCPRWERYGTGPMRRVAPGEVYTLELGVELPEEGYLGLEEMVVVTEDGCAWLSEPQRALRFIPEA